MVTDSAACALPPSQIRTGVTSLFLSNVKGEEHDVVFCSGRLMTVSASQYVAQKVKQLLLLNKGEFFGNNEAGLPWIGGILGSKNPDIEAIKSLIITYIKENAVMQNLGVATVEIPEIGIDNRERSMSITINVETNTATETVEIII